MIGYKLTEEQKDIINKTHFTEYEFFNPVQDINDNWFLFLSEENKKNLKEFDWLLQLKEEEYKPKINKIKI